MIQKALVTTNKLAIRHAIPKMGETAWRRLLAEHPTLDNLIEATWVQRADPIVADIVQKAQGGDPQAQEQFFRRIDAFSRAESQTAKQAQQQPQQVTFNTIAVGADATKAITDFIAQYAPNGLLQAPADPTLEPIEHQPAGALLPGSSFLRVTDDD